MRESIGTAFARLEGGLSEIRSEPREWFVLLGNRLVLAGLLTFAFALSVLALTVAGVVAVDNTTRMLYLLQALVAGNLTLVTIVLSINQLVLSREFRTPGELHDQIGNVIAYRTGVEAVTRMDSVPVTPSAFLRVLLDGTRENAQRLGGAVFGLENDQLIDEVDVLVSNVTAHSDNVKGVLDYSHGGIFSALAVVLETNYSYQLNEAGRIKTVYGEELPPAAEEALDELIASLKQVDIARQYFKSLYTQSELARLSRILLYVGLPAVGGALLLLVVYVAGPGPMSTSTALQAFVLAVLTLGFAPLAVLFSFVVRIATVAQRTVAITPFNTATQKLNDEDR